MLIDVPKYLSVSEKLECIKFLHKVSETFQKESGEYGRGYKDAYRHIEMMLSGAIKRVKILDNENK